MILSFLKRERGKFRNVRALRDQGSETVGSCVGLAQKNNLIFFCTDIHKQNAKASSQVYEYQNYAYAKLDIGPNI